MIEEARVAGDLSRIVLFAMAHTDPKEAEIIQTRKTGLGLASPMLLHIGNEARVKLREWAEAESVRVNAVVVSMLEDFFKQLWKSRALRAELRQEIRAHACYRGCPGPSIGNHDEGIPSLFLSLDVINIVLLNLRLGCDIPRYPFSIQVTIRPLFVLRRTSSTGCRCNG